MNSNYPANFPASWSSQSGSSFSSGSGSLTVLSQSTGPGVTLQFTASPGGFQLSWPQGVLQEATNILGPWIADGLTSPATITTTNPATFYRVKVQ